MTKQEVSFKQNVNMCILLLSMIYFVLEANINVYCTVGGSVGNKRGVMYRCYF